MRSEGGPGTREREAETKEEDRRGWDHATVNT